MSNIQSLRDHVCSYINEKILSGELKPPEKLNENMICEQLNISRTPAREALIMLAAERLIDYVPRKGFYVKKITIADKLQHYALLGNLDAFAAKLAIEFLTDQDILSMQEIVANIDVAIKFKNYSRYIELQHDFHNFYLQKCQNTPLIETIQSLEERFIPITYSEQKGIDEDTYQDILYALNEEHKEMIKLFEKKAITELTQFIENTHWQSKHIDLL